MMPYATSNHRSLGQTTQAAYRTASRNPATSNSMTNAPIQASRNKKPASRPGGQGSSIVKMVDPICTVNVTSGALNVRNNPSTSAERIGGLTRGKTVSVYEAKDGWLRIGYGTGYGWVMAKYTTYKDDPVVVDPTPTPEPDPTPTPEPDPTPTPEPDPTPTPEPDPTPTPDPDPTPTTEEDTSSVGDTGKDYGTLKKGADSDAVKVLQRYLNIYLKKYHNQSFGVSTFKPLEVDGKFGKNTFIQLSYYQYSRNLQGNSGIQVDGICGGNVWKNLRAKTPETYDIRTPKRFEKYKCLGDYDGVWISAGGTMRAKAAQAYEELAKEAKNDKTSGYPFTTFCAYRGMTNEESKRGSTNNEGKSNNSDGQIELFESYNSNTAKCAQPGSSKHQAGIAIDFKDMSEYTSPKHLWMKEHAPKYGFECTVKNEPWHWAYNK